MAAIQKRNREGEAAVSRDTLLLEDVEKAIWRIAPAWVGGDPKDVEVREILRLAKWIAGSLYTKYHRVSSSELAAAAIHEYYRT